VAIDFAPPDGELSGYRLVVVPNLYLASDAAIARLEEFVDAGGTLLVGPFSGLVDQYDHVRLGGYPAGLRSLLGLRVAEFAPMPPGRGLLVRYQGVEHQSSVWQDLIVCEGAEVLGSFEGEASERRPAVTRHRFGEGQAFYVGTCPEVALLDRIVSDCLREAGVKPIAEVPSSVEVARRQSPDGRSYLFLLNHGGDPVTVDVGPDDVDLLTDRDGPTIHLAAGDVAVIAERAFQTETPTGA
jgi:beta-galactosidase